MSGDTKSTNVDNSKKYEKLINDEDGTRNLDTTCSLISANEFIQEKIEPIKAESRAEILAEAEMSVPLGICTREEFERKKREGEKAIEARKKAEEEKENVGKEVEEVGEK